MLQTPFILIRLAFFICWSSFFLSSCSDDFEPISEIPQIEFVSLSKPQIQANKDSLIITIFYQDGNGDIGNNDNEVENLSVTDNRIGVSTGFRIKQLAPDNANVPIQGNLEILLTNISVIDSSQSVEQFTYSIYLIDRAGNQSNTITTATVQVAQ